MYLEERNGKTVVVKERFRKAYRHPLLEEKLSKSRLLQEAKCIEKAGDAGVSVAKVVSVDIVSKKLFLEYLEFPTLKKFLQSRAEGNTVDSLSVDYLSKKIFEVFGEKVAKIHSRNLVHGDLTTSNVLIEILKDDSEGFKLFMIDFGLGKLNASVEDKAVDLYVFERALTSTHPNTEALFELFLKSYESASEKLKLNVKKRKKEEKETVLERLQKVQKRGRKRLAIG